MTRRRQPRQPLEEYIYESEFDEFDEPPFNCALCAHDMTSECMPSEDTAPDGRRICECCAEPEETNPQTIRRWHWFGYHVEWRRDSPKLLWWVRADTFGYRRYLSITFRFGRLFGAIWLGDPNKGTK